MKVDLETTGNRVETGRLIVYATGFLRLPTNSVIVRIFLVQLERYSIPIDLQPILGPHERQLVPDVVGPIVFNAS